jgi:hypothetical protein
LFGVGGTFSHPSLFYSGFFLLLFQIGKMFEGPKEIVGRWCTSSAR